MVPAKVAFGKVEILIGFAKASYFLLFFIWKATQRRPHSTLRRRRKTHLIVTKLMVIDNHPVGYDQ